MLCRLGRVLLLLNSRHLQMGLARSLVHVSIRGLLIGQQQQRWLLAARRAAAQDVRIILAVATVAPARSAVCGDATALWCRARAWGRRAAD